MKLIKNTTFSEGVPRFKLAERLKAVEYITSYLLKERIEFDSVTGTEKKKNVLMCKVKAIK